VRDFRRFGLLGAEVGLDSRMGVGAFCGFVAAIIVLSVVSAPVRMWILGLILGPIIGAIMMGMVS
jgi:hypothetical protein